MSIEYLNAAFMANIKLPAKSVLLALADRANSAGFCYPSIDDIARRAGCSCRSAKRAVNDLEKSGFLRILRKPGQVNKYALNNEKLSTASDTQSPPPVTHSHPSRDTQSPPPVTHSHPGVTGCHGGGDRQSYKPSINHQLTKERDLKKSETTTAKQVALDELAAIRKKLSGRNRGMANLGEIIATAKQENKS